MKEGPGVRAAGEAVDIAAAGQGFPRSFGVQAFVVEEFLRLGVFRRLGAARPQDVADAQGTVGGNPPVFRGAAAGRQRRQQGGLVARWLIALVIDDGQLGHANRSAALLQVQQPAQQGAGFAQDIAAAQQVTQGRKVQYRAAVIAPLEIGHPQPAGMLGPGQGHIEQPQVFRQALFIGQGNQLRGGPQADLGLAGSIVVMQRQAAAIHRLGGTDEGQEHQGGIPGPWTCGWSPP